MMSSNRPYLLRAMREWILDNDMTPHLLVNTEIEGAVVPSEYIDEDKIILNVSPGAIEQADFGNEWIFFSARFAGKRFDIQLPIHSVVAIYAKENGQGMVFHEDADGAEGSDGKSPDPGPGKPGKAGKPNLKLIK